MNTRVQACHIILNVIEKYISLDEALTTLTMNKMDSAFVKELCFGVLRWFYTLRYLANQLLSKSLSQKNLDIFILLLIGLYQILFMRVPNHAAVNETVNACRILRKAWAASLINGVLRNFLRDKAQYLVILENDLQAKYAHPQWLIEKIKQNYPVQWQTILNENNQRAPLTLRVNLNKITPQSYLEWLHKENIEAQLHPIVPTAIVLKSPIDVIELPGFQNGFCSVQDAAAQLSYNLLNLQPNNTILDACAAPGGKLAHILESQLPNLQITAIDIDEKRIKKIEENLVRLQISKPIRLLTADALDTATWWHGQYFDRILLDAPCSSTGVIRRHPDIKILRKASDIEKLAHKQYQLLKTLWPLLKTGGILVYATCSILAEENEKVIEHFLQNQTQAKVQSVVLNVGINQNYGLQILPGESMMDGFYYCVLLKA